MTISPQAQAIYSTLLRSNEPLCAKDLGEILKIFPNTVYRLIDELNHVGLISKSDQYPTRFSAVPADEGLSLFLLSQMNWFSEQFSNRSGGRDVQFSFIKGRDELMSCSATELNKAKSSADILRSGHEIPAETMLAMRNAQKRGVRIRMLIQDYGKHNEEQVAYWKQNGAQVRQIPDVAVRLMIYDKRTAYFMSYKHDDSGKDLGIKINYPPFAVILSQVFDSWWRRARKI